MDTHEACQASYSTAGYSTLARIIIGFMEKMLYTTTITFGDIDVRSKRQYHGHATTQPDLR
jgi:spore maturation protein SpmB